MVSTSFTSALDFRRSVDDDDNDVHNRLRRKQSRVDGRRLGLAVDLVDLVERMLP